MSWAKIDSALKKFNTSYYTGKGTSKEVLFFAHSMYNLVVLGARIYKNLERGRFYANVVPRPTLYYKKLQQARF